MMNVLKCSSDGEHCVQYRAVNARWGEFNQSTHFFTRTHSMASLLDPIQIGEIHLQNRIIMAPLTRLRGTPEHIPTQLMVEYRSEEHTSELQSLRHLVCR